MVRCEIFLSPLFEKSCKIDHRRILQTYNCLIGSSHIDNGILQTYNCLIGSSHIDNGMTISGPTHIVWVSADTVPFFVCFLFSVNFSVNNEVLTPTLVNFWHGPQKLSIPTPM
ncbi:hypothetical protein Hanom_Chr09g00835081 [Helianthus anomalus]